jgi:hypothetical protein
MGALLQNSDSGQGGCSDASYLSGLASAGLDAVGGESEQAPEIDAIMEYLCFLNYGGSGTDNGTNNEVWQNGSHVGKYGCSTFMEPYDNNENFLSASELGSEAGYNYDQGVFEVGLLVGNWGAMASADSLGTYQEMVDEINSQTKKGCVGFQWWYYGGDGSGQTIQIMSDLQSAYGVNMTPIYDRKKGVTPSPSPTPTPTPTPFAKGTLFQGYINQIDVLPALDAAHNGQPTRGMHVIDFWPQGGASATPISYTARPREFQSGYRQFQE